LAMAFASSSFKGNPPFCLDSDVSSEKNFNHQEKVFYTFFGLNIEAFFKSTFQTRLFFQRFLMFKR
jgi:hypothetical protein